MTDTPTFTSRILAVIGDKPGITATELRFAIPEASPRILGDRVGALMDAGRIESVGLGRYRLPEVPKATVSAVLNPSAFVVPMARLMAGR